MGRIKSTLIKRTAKSLLSDEKTGVIFSNNFEENKRILGDNMPSKSIRNKIAGYMARLKKAEKNRQI